MRSNLLTLLTLFLFTFSAWALADTPRTLSLSATAEKKVAPNIAYLNIAVTTQGLVAKDAAIQNATQMRAVADALQKVLGTTGKFQTGSYQVNPAYQYNEATRKSVLTGYEVTNQVRIETANLEGIGLLIDAVMKAGANGVQSLQFGRTDMDALIADVTVTAIQKAKADAAKMAAGAGVTLGNIVDISTNGAAPGPVYKEMRMLSAASDAQTPVIPGEISVTGSVSMVFAIQ